MSLNISSKTLTEPKINGILSNLKNIVSKRILRGVSILLHPCCDITIVDVDYTCTGTNVATIVITLSKAINLLGIGDAVIRSSVNGTYATVAYNDTDTITLTGAAVTAGAATLSGYLFLPTNSDETTGVQIKLPAFSVSPDACP